MTTVGTSAVSAPRAVIAAATALAALVLGACADQAPQEAEPPATTAPTDRSPAPTATDGIAPLAYIDRPFEQTAEDTSRLILLRLPEGQGEVLAEGALTDAVWSPGADRIAYVGREPGQPAPGERLAVTRVGTGETAIVAEGNFSGPTWAPDGARLAVASSEPAQPDPTAIAVAEVPAGTLTAVTEPPPGADDLQPDWSPDGDRIAFLRNLHAVPPDEAPDDARVLSIAPDGTGLQELSPGLFAEGPPTWSPDGETVAFTAAPSPGPQTPTRYLYLAPAGGGEPRRVGLAGARLEVAFAPDGQRLAVPVGTAPDVTDVVVFDLATSSRVATFDGRAFDVGPTWSPDGTHVGFLAASGLEGRTDVALGNVETGELRMLTDDGSVESPDFPPRAR